VTYYDDVYTIDDIKKISNDVAMQLKMSTLAIKNNYFSYLNKGLEKYKVVEEPVVEENELEDSEQSENSEEPFIPDEIIDPQADVNNSEETPNKEMENLANE